MEPVGLRSMTGYGGAQVERDGVVLGVEVRAVNHRHLKVSVRVPELLGGLVAMAEERIRARLSRGTVWVTIRVDGRPAGAAARLDEAALRRLYAELSRVASELGAEAPTLGEVAALPGVVLDGEPLEDAKALHPLAQDALDQALTAMVTMRVREGEGLAAALLATAGELDALTARVEAGHPAAIQQQADRLRARINALLDEPDRLGARDLAREVALISDKADISEELQRLRSHVSQLRDTVTTAGAAPVGRKLEFLAQELVREANTMASKTHDSALIEVILAIKLAVERVREQLANVE